MSKQTTKQALQNWDEYIKNLRRETPVPVETDGDKQKRIARLKKNFPDFCKYYFPNYTDSDFGDFHLRAQRKIEKSDHIYMVNAFAREHAKSVVFGLMVPLFEMVNGRMNNMMMVSHNFDNACELLMPIMLNLENNQRLIADYGKFRSFRDWTVGKFVTGDGKSFRAVGAGQSPRGSRNEEKRPDFICIDDIDTDEEARNQKRIDDKWKWIEQALFPCMSITGRKRFIFNGNIISKESCIVKASRVADFYQKVNILDKNGKPSWSRYTLEQVNYMLSKISYASGQKEYFNNPINEGTVFTDLRWGKVPHLTKFKFLVHYLDASYKSSASRKGDFKGGVLLGVHDGILYIIRCGLEQCTLAQSINWFYDSMEFVDGKTTVYHFVEVNGLQDPWYEDVFLPACKKVEKERGYSVSVAADRRSKPDKFTRIEAALEPLNRLGKMVFNEKMKEDPHMRRLVEQFEAIEPALNAHDDGPDAVEGGYHIANNKLRSLAPIKTGRAKRGKKYRF